ncbi:MAG: hypothetical protein LC749_19685, partial [Actinobacteria bacterium]|nr:hypothetical protein [Actinomycetota bacterium]
PGGPGTRTLSSDELTDRVFAGVESLLALDTAVLLAPVHVGVDLSTVDWRSALGLDDVNGARLMLTMAGWQDVGAEVDGRTLVICASAPLGAFSIGTLGALGSVLESRIERIRASVALSDGRNVVLEGPTALLHDSGPDGPSGLEGIRMAELLCGFTLDGQPLVSRDWIRRWSTSVLIPAIQEPLITAMPQLKSVRDLAQRIEDEELAQTATGAMTLVRRLALGDKVRVVDTETYKRIEAWANLETDPIRI